MSTTKCPDNATAEEIYKQLLRKERAAWDALFARPGSHELRLWRHLTVKADEARTAFLGLRAVAGDQSPRDAERDASLRQALKIAIQEQKVAWTALEQSMRSDAGEDPELRAAWLVSVRRVRDARNLLHAPTAAAPAAK